MNTQDLKEKETQLIAELANRVLLHTGKNQLAWSLDIDQVLRVKLANGHAILCPYLDSPDVTRFAVFDTADKELGAVNNGHPVLRYDLGDCYRRLLAKLDTNWHEHQAKVTAISSMFGELDKLPGEDAAVATTQEEEVVDDTPEAAPAVVEEDEIDALHDEDAEFAFQDAMAEQAEEFGQAAREEAGVEPEEPLASLPGQVAPKQAARPAPSPPPPASAAAQPPRMKKVIRKVKRTPGPVTAVKSRVLDQGS